MKKLEGFFRLWMFMEAHYSQKYFSKGAIEDEVGEGRFKRSFPIGKNTDLSEGSSLCTAIRQYINNFDKCLKRYLYEELSPDEFEDMYIKSLEANDYII